MRSKCFIVSSRTRARSANTPSTLRPKTNGQSNSERNKLLPLISFERGSIMASQQQYAAGHMHGVTAVRYRLLFAPGSGSQLTRPPAAKWSCTCPASRFPCLVSAQPRTRLQRRFPLPFFSFFFFLLSFFFCSPSASSADRLRLAPAATLSLHGAHLMTPLGT